nr:hypothetical protein [Tanacetum cinerariifolium]
MVVQSRFSQCSKEDQINQISKSVFVTNFPDHVRSRDLWQVCNAYGTLVDVYIPLKKSQSGKRFTFLRFIKVINLERLIENLCTIWIGSFRLHANMAHFQRDQNSKNPFPKSSVRDKKHSPPYQSKPVLVLDESYIKERDFSKSLIGQVKEVSTIPNLYIAFLKEGFDYVNITYLGDSYNSDDEPDAPGEEHKLGDNEFEKPINDSDVEKKNGKFPLSKDSDPIYPLGFTPVSENINKGEGSGSSINQEKSIPEKKQYPSHNMEASSQRTTSIPINGGSILKVMDDLVKVGHAMGHNMEGCSKNIAEDKKGWVQELCRNHKINFVALQETKMESIDPFSIKALWGNLAFDHAMSPSVGLIDLPLGGYSYTWAHKSASKMSKLDRFLISEGLMVLFPHLSGLCIDRKLSDHRPIIIRKLTKLDKIIDQGKGNEEVVNQRASLLKDLNDINSIEVSKLSQKAKVRWSIEDDENSKYFHAILNSKRSQLFIRGIHLDGDWIADPNKVDRFQFTLF